jgi:hypothetical protein
MCSIGKPEVLKSDVFIHIAIKSKVDMIGPSGVRALPLAAGRNEGGHYFR